jgi:hypothetical protein
VCIEMRAGSGNCVRCTVSTTNLYVHLPALHRLSNGSLTGLCTVSNGQHRQPERDCFRVYCYFALDLRLAGSLTALSGSAMAL